MAPSDWIAIAAVASTAAVGISAIVFKFLAERGDRLHRENLARADRRFQIRSTSYSESGQMLEEGRYFVVRTYPPLQPPEPPDYPDFFDADKWKAIIGRRAVSSSRAALIAIEEAFDALTAFVQQTVIFGAALLEQLPSEEARPVADARPELERRRQAALDAIDAAEDLMRRELESL